MEEEDESTQYVSAGFPSFSALVNEAIKSSLGLLTEELLADPMPLGFLLFVSLILSVTYALVLSHSVKNILNNKNDYEN